MSLDRTELIRTLSSTPKETLSKCRTSSQSYLTSGLVGRTFNAFPSLVTDQQVKELEVIMTSIREVDESIEGYCLRSQLDKEAIEKWYLDVAIDGCRQILDGYNHIKWALIDLLGWEKFESCYTSFGVHKLIYSYVHAIFQQAAQRAAAVINLKPCEYFSALGIYLNAVSDQLTQQARKITQAEDTRTREMILKALRDDYHVADACLERRSNFLSKLTSNRDKERKIERTIISRGLSDNTTELDQLFLQMSLDCEEQSIANAPLARVVKHYINILYSLKLNTKPSTLHVKQRLESAPSRAETKVLEFKVLPAEESKESLVLMASESAEDRVGPCETLSSEERTLMEEYVFVESEEAKESETYRMNSLVWWISFFINPSLMGGGVESEKSAEKLRGPQFGT